MFDEGELFQRHFERLTEDCLFVCPSVRPSIHPSVCSFVLPFIRLFIRVSFFLECSMAVRPDDHGGTNVFGWTEYNVEDESVTLVNATTKAGGVCAAVENV